MEVKWSSIMSCCHGEQIASKSFHSFSYKREIFTITKAETVLKIYEISWSWKRFAMLWMPIAYTLAHGEGLISIEFVLSLCDLWHTDMKHIKICVSSAAPRWWASRRILRSVPGPQNALSARVRALHHPPSPLFHVTPLWALTSYP